MLNDAFKYGILMVLCMILQTNGFSQEMKEFSFDENGEFKILQLTDLHLNDKTQEIDDKTVDLSRVLIRDEKPDLVVLTGDVVTSPPVEKGWLAIGRLFAEEKVYWTVTLGNHDGRDAGNTREEVYALLKGLPYFIGDEGAKGVKGVGNYTLPIYSSKSKNVSFVLYFFDSHNRPPHKKYGHWAWIDSSQIEWYREQSRKYRAINEVKRIPALSFFHIPLPEIENILGDINTLGTQNEGISSPKINTGLFSAFVDCEDVIGVFTGHDHDNDYLGIAYDIALGYGRLTGEGAYGDLERGGRIIKIYENEFKFDTWIRTPDAIENKFYFPSGISSRDEENLDYLEASEVKISKKGVNYSYYEGGRFKNTKDIFKNGRLVKTGNIDRFSIEPATAKDSIGFVFESFLRVPKEDIYRFYLQSDDGSCLYINDQLIIDNDGSHNSRRIDGKIGLKKGYHKIRVEYFQDYMGKELEVGWSSKGIFEEEISGESLFLTDQ